MQPFAPALNLPAHIEVEAHYRPDRHHPAPDLPSLVLIRGIPGSGKSTLAKHLAALDYRHFEADDYFMVNGRYCYDASRITQAHDWCRQQVLTALRSGHRVVVANTFTRAREVTPYAQMSDDALILWARGRWQNVHDVPHDIVARMASRWEPLAPGLQAMPPHDATREGSLLGHIRRGGSSGLRVAGYAPKTLQPGSAPQADGQGRQAQVIRRDGTVPVRQR